MNCPKCNKEVGADDKFCPYCGSKINITKVLSDTLQTNTMLKDKYRIERVLEENESCIKYLAQDLTLQFYVIVTEFYPKNYVKRERESNQVNVLNETDKSLVNQWHNAFLDSVRNKTGAGNLTGISDIKDCFEMNGTAYVVTEWLSGDDLQTFLDRQGYAKPNDSQYGLKKRIYANAVKQIFEPIIASLSKLHDLGIAYGNISLEDMRFGNNGMLKLSGFVWDIKDKGSAKEKAQADVYAICAAMYKCITGVFPANGGNLKSPSELGIDIDKYDEAAIMMGLSSDLARRFPNVVILRKALYRPQTVQSSQINQVSQAVQPSGYNQNVFPDQALKKKSGAKTAIIILVVIVLLAGIGAAGVMILPDLLSRESSSSADNTEDENNESDESDEMVESSETIEEASEEELNEDDIEAYKAVLEQADADDSVENKKNALEQLITFVSENNASEYAAKDMAEIFDDYKSGVLEHVEVLNGQDVSPAVYTQMNIELTEALDMASRIGEQNIEVDSDSLQDKADSIKADYKQRLIDNFDSKAQEAISSNGVISRSVLWKAMEGADQTGLYSEEDYNDPLRLRYVLALAYNVDSELESLGRESAVERLYEVLESTDYNPLLLYYLGDIDSTARDYWLYAENVLADNGYDFYNMTTNEKRNFVYYYYTDDSYASVRDELRTYMKNNLVQTE